MNGYNNLQLFGVGETHQGLNRGSNEDRYLVNNQAQVYAVADGIGGLPLGEKASQCAINVLNRLISEHKAGDDGIENLTTESIIHSTNQAVRQISKLTKLSVGIGTTLSFVRMVNGICEAGHVGDSAIYLLREKSIEKISPEHSQQSPTILIKNPNSNQEKFNSRKVLSQYIGQTKTLRPSIFCINCRPDDRLLICSDGVSDTLASEDILSVSLVQEDPQKLVQALIAMVLLRGGLDNATALILEIREVAQNNI